MNEKILYDECIAFIEDLRNIKWSKYQRDIIKAICEETEILFARGTGKNFIAENYSKYLAHVYDKSICDEAPELLMSYESFMSGDS